jgi:hypothetical protein
MRFGVQILAQMASRLSLPHGIMSVKCNSPIVTAVHSLANNSVALMIRRWQFKPKMLISCKTIGIKAGYRKMSVCGHNTRQLAMQN